VVFYFQFSGESGCSKTFCPPRGIIPENLSSIDTAASEDVRNK